MDEAKRRLAVLGHPVSHSRSPAMQNAALEDLGLGESWHYEAIEVLPEDFDERVGGMAAEGFSGVNVTVPHKEAALRLADRASGAAEGIGAANTLIFEAEGIRAENTDGPGLLDALPDRIAGRAALVLGAGGAARAVVWALIGAGAKVGVWNRRASRAERLAIEMNAEALVRPDAASFDFVVNASAAGLGGGDGIADLPVRAGQFRSGQVVVDLVYGESPSTLLAAARGDGADTVDGLEILVLQGARSLEIWTGRKPSLEVMRAAARG